MSCFEIVPGEVIALPKEAVPIKKEQLSKRLFRFIDQEFVQKHKFYYIETENSTRIYVLFYAGKCPRYSVLSLKHL
jgi:hypothetical protein